MRPFRVVPLLLVLAAATLPARAAPDGNRLAYLDDGVDPYYVSRTFPKLVTPQWVGEPGVDAVVVLAIDDMRDPAKYEAFLRPALDRLKKIDGRAPVSIMTCDVQSDDPRLQAFLKEGLSLECHTIDHPCPLLANGDLAKAKSTYDRCVERMSAIPGNAPVAFRTPCCDSRNTFGPRVVSELFNRTTDKGHFLSIDSSVFNILTPNDPDLPRNLVQDEQGRERFRRYLPFPGFANTIEDYPYPYVIGHQCWEFPCVVPSDWESFNVQGKASPRLLDDWKAALDAIVIKRGTFTAVFHPYGWSSPQQIADLVDYADTKYGKRVKFLTFREAKERLDKNLLGGQLRAHNGGDNGVRLLDLNGDGYLDVVVGNDLAPQTRVWLPAAGRWDVSDFPGRLVSVVIEPGRGETERRETGLRFGVVGADAQVCAIVVASSRFGGPAAWRFDTKDWVDDNTLFTGLATDPKTGNVDWNLGVRLRDLNGDGACELIVSNEAIYTRDERQKAWLRLPFGLPDGTPNVAGGGDAGLRFVDVDGDGRLDVLRSGAGGYSLDLWDSMKRGWSRRVVAKSRGGNDDPRAIPPLIRKDGTDNGAWFHGRALVVANEDTSGLPDLVDRKTFNEMLADVEPDTPRGPEAALASIQLRPGFRAELVAAEPLVEDPIAFAWGADGKLWVVEMGDYPLGVGGQGKPGGPLRQAQGGRVKFLESTHNDGHYDKATVFLDGLNFPTGVTPWRNGVIVVAAPDVFYAEDTDGDGKADWREVLFTGFAEGNQQHRANGLVYGLDNWFYGANGHSNGTIKSIQTGDVTNISGRDFRLRPGDGAFETTAGVTQFGRACDDWGNWFGCDNSNSCFHFALDDHYLRRNPHYAPPVGRTPVPEVPGAAPVFPASRTVARYNDFHTANHFTSACSVAVYRDDLFGPAFYGNTFVSEPVHDLIHREVVTPKGATFASRRADDERASEFFASTDNWCRPTTIKTGPDGALWVADMYRYVIEHPQWIPKEIQSKLDLRAGHDKGRIYRILPVGVAPRPIPRLNTLDAAGLVAALDSPSGWQRDTAQQLLVERQDKAAVPALEKLAAECKRPLGRLHALCALDGLHALTPEVLARALADEHPGVRRHAARLSEPFLDPQADLAAAVVKLAGDADAQVRMQVAYSLGEWHDARAGDALGAIAVAAQDDPLLIAAVMSSVNETNLGPILRAVTERTPPPPALLAGLLRQAAAMGDKKATATLLDAVTHRRGDAGYEPWQYSAMDSLLDGLAQSGSSLSAIVGDEPSAAARANDIFAAARALAVDAKADEPQRAAAIRLLGRGPDHREDDIGALAGMLSPRSPAAVQSAAVAALGQQKRKDTAATLLAGWKGYSPSVRAAALDVLLGRAEWAAALLDAIESKVVLPGDLDAARRQKLLKSGDAKVKARAAALLASTANPDRQKVIDHFKPAVTLRGDVTRGAAVFAKTCAACHQLGGVGHAVGPDLASVGDKTGASLIVSILDPNRAVDPKYTAYVAETAGGETVVGVLSAETGNSVTLVQADGNARAVLRTDLKALKSTGLSLMPDGLEAGASAQDLADLMQFVRTAGGAK